MHPYVPELVELYKKGKTTRREFLKLSALLGLSFPAATLIAACGGATETQAPTLVAEPTNVPAVVPINRGGRLRVSLRVHPLVDPATNAWGDQSNISRQIAEHLTLTDYENITRPLLLESWEPSEDLKTWTLNLRRGINFNMGRELDADDVVWNIKRWLDPDTGSSIAGLLSGYLQATNVEKVDNYTIRLHLDRAELAVPEHLYHHPAVILPREFEGDWEKQPWGTGPFELEEYIEGERVTLKRRVDYWKAGEDGEQLPYLETIVFTDFGDEPAGVVATLASDDLDFTALQITTLGTVETLEHVKIHIAKTSRGSVFRMRADQEPWNDERVRNALKICQDRAKILNTAHLGYGDLAGDYHVAPAHAEYYPMDPPKQDIEKAKSLLADAGYSDGLEVTLTVMNDPEWYSVCCQLLKEMAEPAGFKINIEVVPSSIYWDQWTDVNFGFTNWGHRPLAVMILGLPYTCGADWNETHWCDETFETMLTEASGTYDLEQRRELMGEIQSYMQEHGPIGVPFWQNWFEAANNRIQGYTSHPSGHLYFDEVWLT